MPKLTEEQLAKLYPRAKTYDEVQAEREQLRELRRPKLVAEKIGLLTTLCLPVAYVFYRLIARIVGGLANVGEGATGPVLSGVSFSILLGVVGCASLYYLYWLADSVASKVVVATSVLYALLFGILGAAVTAYVYIVSSEYHEAVALLLLPLTFLAAYAVSVLVLKKQ